MKWRVLCYYVPFSSFLSLSFPLPLLFLLCVDFQLIRLRRIKNTPSHRYQISAILGRWWMAVAEKSSGDSSFTRLFLACSLISPFTQKRVSPLLLVATLTSLHTKVVATTGKNVLPVARAQKAKIS